MVANLNDLKPFNASGGRAARFDSTGIRVKDVIHMIKTLTAGLALATFSMLTYAGGVSGRQPLDFKGLVVGSAMEQASVERALGIKCDSDGIGQRIICNGVSTIVDSPAKVNVVIGPDGVLDRMSRTACRMARFQSFKTVSAPILGRTNENGLEATEPGS
jgi:hypothetical protein